MLEYFADLYDLTGDENIRNMPKERQISLFLTLMKRKKEEVFMEHGTELTLQEW